MSAAAVKRTSAQKSMGFAAEQAEGGASPRVLHDRLHLGYVRTRDGQEVLLGIVADGGNSPRAGAVADAAVRSAVEAVARSSADGLSRALASGLQSAAAAWKASLGEGSPPLEVSATAVCVVHRRLFAAHAGRSTAFLVRGGQAYPLMKSTGPLGAMRSQEPIAGPKEGLELKPGDWVMIASDGLTRASGETGRPFVEPSEIPGCLQGSEPREAARHLISLALGRDADDNVSVGLIRLPGEAVRRSRRPMLWAMGAAAMVLLGGLAVASFLNRAPVTMTDYGYAVVLEGSGLAQMPGAADPVPLGRLDLVSAGATLRTSSPMQLSLQSTAGERGSFPSATLYLAADTQLELVQLDAYPDNAPSDQSLVPAILEVQSGRMLISLRGSPRPVHVRAADGLAVLGVGQAATLGARLDLDSAAIDCLSGTCHVFVGSGREIALPSGDSLQLPAGLRVSLTASELEAWQALCADCFEPAP